MTKHFYKWALALFLLLPFCSHAIVIKVDDTGDPAPAIGGTQTLRDAIAAAAPGDTVLIDVRGTIALSSSLTIDKDIVIIGPYPIHCTIDLNGNNQIFFNLPLGNPIHFKGVKIVNTPVSTGAALFVAFDTDVIMTDCVLKDLKSSASGGAVLVAGYLIAKNCSFINNSAINDGGAVFISNSSNGEFENCTFYGNTADQGGALYNSGICSLSNCTFYENTSASAVGHDLSLGLPAANTGIRNCIFANTSGSVNQISNPGGGVLGSLGGNVYTFNPIFAPPGSDDPNVSMAMVGFASALPMVDGYGLEYFKLTPGSVAVDNGVSIILPPTDCRRAPRVLFGVTAFAPDAGAVEYTPHRVQNFIPTLSPGSLAFVINNVNGSSFPPYYVEFETGAGTVNLTSALSLTQSDVYIDGYSQQGSMVYGPGVLPNTVTPPNTPFKILSTGAGSILTVINNSNVRIAGLTITGRDRCVEFVNGFNHAFFGNVVTQSNLAGVAAGSITGLSIGGQYHHQRNCIKDHTATGIDINGCTTVNITGNFIGIEETGTAAGPAATGIMVTSSSNFTIGGDHFRGRGNTLGGCTQAAISISGGNIGQVHGNYIGLNYQGIANIANQTDGIRLSGTGTNITIGKTGPAFRNYIAACDYFYTNSGAGIKLNSFAGSVGIYNNYIGLNVNNAPAGNAAGVWVINSTGMLLGDASSAVKRNYIGYNSRQGVFLEGTGTSGNSIGKNFIGLKRDNTAAPNAAQGVLVLNGPFSNTIINNVVANGTGFQHGIEINTAGNNNDVAGNLVGTDSTGMTAIPNFVGVNILFSGTGTVVRNNLISGNTQEGVSIDNTNDVTLYSNIIGLNIMESAPLPNNKNGIFCQNSPNIKIGTASGGNRISGNGESGIRIDNSTSCFITRNYIGTNASGLPLGNQLRGVNFTGISSNNNVGTPNVPADSNTIMFNLQEGVYVSPSSFNVGIHHNRIHQNTGKGISLGPAGAMVNDLNDADAAGFGNQGQNYPELLAATNCGGTTKIAGNINIDATGIPYIIDFFSIPAGEVDATNHGEGNHYLGSITVTPSALVHDFIFTSPTLLPIGTIVSATCSKSSGLQHGTSEFSDTIKVKLPPVPVASALANVLCAGDATGTASVSYTGIAPVTYQWFNGATALSGYSAATASGLAAGDYHLMISDGTGCTFTSDTVTITEPLPLSASITPVPETCSGDNDGSVQVLINAGGTPTFNVDYYTSATLLVNSYTGLTYGGTATENGLSPGGYYAVVTDGIGCKDTLTFSITASVSFVNAAFTAPAVACSGDPVTFTSASGGSPAVTSWQWDFGDLNTGTGGTTNNTYLAAGTYTVQLVADNGVCDDTATVSITINAPPTVNAGPDLELCSNTIVFSTLNGTVTGTGTYSWSATEVVSWAPDNLSLTTDAYYSGAAVSSGSMYFILTATQTGCTPVDDSIHVVFTPPHSAFAGTDITLCASSPIVLNGTITGATSATWSGAGTFSPSASTLSGVTYTPTAAEITTGSATITLTTDPLGACATATDNITVTLLTTPVANAGIDQSVCPGGTAVLNGSGSTGSITSYQWEEVSGPVLGTTPSISVTPTVTTQYILTTGNGVCSDADTVEVSVVPLPDASFSYSSAPFCLNDAGEVPVSAVPGGYYDVVGGLGVTLNTATGEIFPSASLPGTYNIYHELTTPCLSRDTITIVIYGLPVVTVTATPVDHTLCYGDTLDFSATPAGGTWTPVPGFNTSTTQFAATAAGPGAKIIEYSFTDANGCTATDTFNITVNPLPVVSISGLTATTYCTSEGPIPLVGSPTGIGGFFLNGVIASPGSTYNYDPAVVGVDSIAYIYQDGTTGCYNTAFALVTVTAAPPTPILTAAAPYEFCATNPQTLTVSNPATTVSWYSDASLTTLIASGTSLSTSLLADGTNTAYVVNKNSGACVSTALPVNYTNYTFTGVSLGGPYETCSGTPATIQLTVPAGITYGWLPQTGLEDTTAIQPVVSPVMTTTYTVVLSIGTLPSCTSTDSVTVTVSPCSLENVTNAFSPDGDGTNDTWIIAGIEQHPQNRVIVFNRWGDKLLQFDGYNNADVVWDGKFNGTLVAAGTYYFSIEYLDDGQQAAGWLQLNY